MFKFLLSLLFAVAFFFVVPNVAFAQMDNTASMNQQGSTYRHAYKPQAVQQQPGMVNSTAMRARVDNFSNTEQHRLVCVEAWKGGSKTHLGCLQAHTDAMGGQNWSYEFDTPQVSSLSSGTYQIAYSYQEADGSWHGVRSVNMTVQNGQYQAS